MEFFIKQNTDLPLLKMQIVKNGRQDYKYICDLIERSAIYFSMIDDATGNPKIVNASAGFVNKVFIEPNSEPEYYLYYRFNKNDTNRSGRFRGEFSLISDFGTLITPIADNLYINIGENFVSEGCDDNCGTFDFPCCPDSPPLSYNFDFFITISSGSVIADYSLVADKPLITDLTFSFTNELGVYNDDPIIFETQVKINSGEISGTTQNTSNTNFDSLNGVNLIYDTKIDFQGRDITFDVSTKPPTYDPPTEFIDDAILVSDTKQYIEVGKNLYLSFKELFIDDAILVDGKNQYIDVGINLYLSYKE